MIYMIYFIGKLNNKISLIYWWYSSINH